MIHSSQKPPDKLPLTKGQAVDTMVKFLNQDKYSPPPKTNIIISPSAAAHNNNQPFSYTKPTSVSPDPNLYARSLSPDRPPSPINKMNEDSNRGIIYAQVVCGDNGVRGGSKQTIHTSVPREKFGHNSDEDEGLGYEDTRMKYRDQTDYSYRNFDDTSYHVKDSPITPRFKEFRNHKFVGDELEYENEYPPDDYDLKDLRGRGDGMDARRRESLAEPDDSRFDKKADLSYRRELLENRFNARRNRDQTSPGNTRYTPEKDFVEEASPIETTRKYVNETSARYFKDSENVASGFSEKYTSEVKKERDGTLTRNEHRAKSKFNPNTSMFEPVSAKELDRREFIDKRLAEEPRETKYFSQKHIRYFPPEPDYEPPSLDSQASGPRYSPEDRKYKKAYTSSQDGLNSTSRYKHKHEKFGSNRDHYASNPEIAQKRADAFNENRDEYDPSRPETYHNSLRRQSHNKSDKHYRMSDDYLEQTSSRSLRQQDSNGKKDYGEETSGPESSRSRYDNDRDRDNKFADSGIENDYRKDSNGDIHSRGAVPSSSKDYHGRKPKSEPRNESEDEGFASSLLIASERQHTEDNCSPVKGKFNLDSMDYRRSAARREEFIHRERSIDDGSFYDPRLDKFEERTTLHRVDAKPPKAVKKISGLEKMKQLFSRDSSKKSKKDKEKYKANETRVQDNNAMVKEEDLRRRYTEYRGSSEDLDVIDSRRGRLSKHSDLESESRNSLSIARHSRTSKYRDDEDSSAMDYDYSQRRRMATPSPSPSPPRRPVEKPTVQRKDTPRKPLVSSTNGWFKSLDRLSKNKSKTSKVEKDSVLTTTEEESNFTPKRYTPNSSKAPTKSLRFFGDTDQESNGSSSKNQTTLRKRSSNASAKIESQNRTLTRNGKSLSSSVHALDRTERYDGHRSSSLTNLQNGLDSRQNLLANSYNKEKYNGNRRDLHNISEIHSNSETESQFEEREKYYKENGRDYKNESDAMKGDRKPPMSPLRDKRRSRSHSAPKISKSMPKTYHGSRGDLVDDNRTYLPELHTSKNDLRGIKPELMGSKSELRSRRRRVPAAGATSPADSSTEGDSSHQSQRSTVYLHAATVGDIPSKGRISRGKSRDDVSSVNSSLNPHVKTVSRSFSVLAPWKPRHYREGQDINYSQSGHQSTMKRSEKSSRTSTPVKNESTFGFNKNKSNSTRNLTTSKYDVRPSEERTIPPKSGSSTLTRHLNKTEDRKKSTSSSTLNRKTDKLRSGHASSKENLGSQHFNTMSKTRSDLRDRNYKKSMSTEVLSRESPPKGTKRSSIEREKLARSISMPKDPNKSAGWFRISKKSKKIENPSRVY
ncbi:bloated isoform X2 [Arctopsyche grandis]